MNLNTLSRLAFHVDGRLDENWTAADPWMKLHGAGEGPVAMRSQSWFGKLWKRLRSSIVDDVPSGLEGCEICREVECTQQRWESCERRLATEAARKRETEAWDPIEVAKRPVGAADSAVRSDVVRKPTPVSS